MQEQPPQVERETAPAAPGRSWSRFVVNLSIVLALVAFGYGAYSYITGRSNPGDDPAQPPVQARKIIQMDVLNGCGARGAAARITSVLRNAGFDVVEMKNYKVRTMQKTLVVDRVGDLASARRVATTLGIAESNIIQQLNPDYFVDVSVIIGADYTTLQPLRH